MGSGPGDWRTEGEGEKVREEGRRRKERKEPTLKKTDVINTKKCIDLDITTTDLVQTLTRNCTKQNAYVSSLN